MKEIRVKKFARIFCFQLLQLIIFMSMYEIEETGGARIGWAKVSWPFATLKVNSERLEISTGMTSTLVFSPADIISIEPDKAISFTGQGIKINHTVSNYSNNVVFWSRGNAADLINRIGQTGFLKNADNTSYVKSTEVTESQVRGVSL